MKRILAILKDLQDSGQEAVIVGQNSVQTGRQQDVTNINTVHKPSKISNPETDQVKNLNRYTTEHERENADCRHLASIAVALPLELLGVIETWPSLPNPVRAGILAMVQAASASMDI